MSKMDQDVDLPKLHDKVANALMKFVDEESDADRFLSFKELGDAMVETNSIMSAKDKLLYDGLISHDGKISQSAFLEGMRMLFDEEESLDTQWSAPTLYEGLQLLLAPDESDISDESDDNDQEDKPPNTKAPNTKPSNTKPPDRVLQNLAKGLFKTIDSSGSGTLTMSELKKGLCAIDSASFTNDFFDEMDVELGGSVGGNISQEEFIDCFSNCAESIDITKVDNNFAMYLTNKSSYKGKKETEKIQKQKRHTTVPTMNKKSTESTARRQYLANELQKLNKEVKDTEKRFEFVARERGSTQDTVQKLTQEQRRIRDQLLKKRREQMELKASEQAYKEKAEKMKERLALMEQRLAETRAKTALCKPVNNRRMRGSFIMRLELDLTETENKLRDVSKSVEQQTRTLKKVNESEKKKLKKMKQLKKKAKKVRKLETEKERVKRENDMLAESLREKEKFLNEERMVKKAPVSEISFPSFVDDDDLAEMKREAEELEKRQDGLSVHKKEIDGEMMKKKKRRDKMNREIAKKNKKLANKNRKIGEKERAIEKEKAKWQRNKFKPTADPLIYTYGKREVDVRNRSGRMYAIIGTPGSKKTHEEYVCTYEEHINKVCKAIRKTMKKNVHIEDSLIRQMAIKMTKVGGNQLRTSWSRGLPAEVKTLPSKNAVKSSNATTPKSLGTISKSPSMPLRLPSNSRHMSKSPSMPNSMLRSQHLKSNTLQPRSNGLMKSVSADNLASMQGRRQMGSKKSLGSSQSVNDLSSKRNAIHKKKRSFGKTNRKKRSDSAPKKTSRKTSSMRDDSNTPVRKLSRKGSRRKQSDSNNNPSTNASHKKRGSKKRQSESNKKRQSGSRIPSAPGSRSSNASSSPSKKRSSIGKSRNSSRSRGSRNSNSTSSIPTVRGTRTRSNSRKRSSDSRKVKSKDNENSSSNFHRSRNTK